jgi:L-ascorbate metabolism protein UlaG (beta-lactamase superfamily)
MTSATKYRLSDSTCIEPLVNKWSAWSFLLSPMPASLHLARYQRQVMSSYLEDPATHIAASHDREFETGPFMNISIERQDDVGQLLADTLKKQAHNIQLAEEFMAFNKKLTLEAKGQTLETYYAQIPEILRGYVELVYDYSDRPSIRVLENLLYHSRFYDASLQSLRISQLKSDDSRSFIFNTPRLKQPEEIDWAVEFASTQTDLIFQLDTQPRRMKEILDALGMGSMKTKCVEPFLSSASVRVPKLWRSKQIRLRYIGHACVLIEWNGISILTDAFVPVRPVQGGLERFSYSDLPEYIDFVLITHNHQDHYVFETLLRLRHRIKGLVVPKSLGFLYGDLSLKLLSRILGFKNVTELDVLESISFPDGEIIGTPFFGEHGDYIQGKIGYVVRCGKEKILFAADSDCLDVRVYEHLRNAIGKIQTVFLSVEPVGAPLSWVNGPLLPQQPAADIEQQRRYHACDARRALELADALGANRLYNYAMGLEPWTNHLLGSNMGEGSEQWKQSERMITCARGRGYHRAERLFGKATRFVDTSSFSVSTGSGASHEKRLRKPERRAKIAFWKQQLANSLNIIEDPSTLQTAGLASPVVVKRMTMPEWQYPVGSFENKSSDVSFAIISMAAFLAAWNKSTNQQDFLVIMCVPGDVTHGAHEKTASGRTLPLRVDVSGDPSFERLALRVDRAFTAAAMHELDPAGMRAVVRDAFSSRSRWGIQLEFVFSRPDPMAANIQQKPDSKNPPQAPELTVIFSEKNRGNELYVDYIWRGMTIAMMIDNVHGNFIECLQHGTRFPHELLSQIRLTVPETPEVPNDDVQPQFSF